MVTAIFAIGPQGQFGYRGGLPWGSFPQELEAYNNALNSVFSGERPVVLLIGKSTWETLPEKARDKLINKSSQIWVYGRSEPSKYGVKVNVLTEIGYTLPPQWEYHDVLCVGGAYLLNKLFELGHIDKAYISRVWWNLPAPINSESLTEFPCDSWLKVNLEGITSQFICKNYEFREHNSLWFMQELFYF